jgi:hypothetical protein
VPRRAPSRSCATPADRRDGRTRRPGRHVDVRPPVGSPRRAGRSQAPPPRPVQCRGSPTSLSVTVTLNGKGGGLDGRMPRVLPRVETCNSDARSPHS